MRSKLEKRKTEDNEKGDVEEKTGKDISGKRLVQQQRHKKYCETRYFVDQIGVISLSV